MDIRTTYHYKEILTFFDLKESEQNEIKDDYDTVEESSFFRYKNRIYDLNEFMRLDKNSPFSEYWHAYLPDSFFSGVLIHLSDCGDAVIPATYFSWIKYDKPLPKIDFLKEKIIC